MIKSTAVRSRSSSSRCTGVSDPVPPRRYWIDLRRSGHVVRQEIYTIGPEECHGGSTRYKLAPFKVGKSEVWMPVAGNSSRYSALVDRKHGRHEGATVRLRGRTLWTGRWSSINIPRPEVFTIKYKPGTPISDNLRKLTYEFGQQKIGPKPTRAATEKMLEEQISKAEEQKSELVVASTSEGFPWSTWLAWGFGAVVVVLSVVLWIQRRGH